MKKRYLVFGARGSIGSVIVRALLNQGHEVVACMRYVDEDPVREELAAYGAAVGILEDVSEPAELRAFHHKWDGEYDGIIYSVGHCPPNGFPDAVKHPLSELPLATSDNENRMHVRGPICVFQEFAGKLSRGGSFVFISSKITRLADDDILAKLPFGFHIGAIENMNCLIFQMRRDPIVLKNEINVYRIVPPAVDTSFHHGGPRPPAIVSTEAVTHKVLLALAGETDSEDVEVEPDKPVAVGA